MFPPIARQRQPPRDRPPITHPMAKEATGGSPGEPSTDARLRAVEREIRRIKMQLQAVLKRVQIDDIAPFDDAAGDWS